MKKLLIYMTVLMSIILSACGGGGSGLTLKYGDQEKDFTTKSSFVYHSTKTFSTTKDGKTEKSKASVANIYLANFDLDTSRAMISVSAQKIEKPEHIKVAVSVIGEEGTSSEEPLKPGTFLPENKKFQTLNYVEVFGFEDGKQKRTSFKINKLQGKVVIDSVTDEKITGSIDITDGENSVKGNFTADAPESKK